ncbi:hypothetical protein EYM_06690 [Ignicoccus islandicus DSM 13165]|uniref:VTT domain-containing protein n=1 Tax=Ignicoccus islandicus DSM 13165 TaxID=940295 RepID=A0A0U3G0W8_9CREN|nr:VTT domain-containing protein [Ignicoccus islandicus]ALU11964.1 hypothetical protein EYM_06690 [Ignicoccus islandicus DSM 13165]
MDFNEFISDLNNLVIEYGPLGVFIISLVGNAIPYATVPYLAVIAAMASQMRLSLVDVIIWSVVGGLGAAIGKVIVYLTGVATSEILPEKVKRNMHIFASMAKRGIFIAIFLFAALPLPDDVLYIPLGVARYPLTKFFIAVWMGKVIITFLSIVFGNAYGEISSQYNLGAAESVLILIIVTLVLSAIIARIDWVRVGIALSEKGLGEASVVLGEELLKAMGIKKVIDLLKGRSDSKKD